MKSSSLYINCLIDCESTQSSLKDSDLGERSILGFAEVLCNYGLKGTYYAISPELEAIPSLFNTLVEEGHEVGLHLHPAEEGPFQEFLGIYGPEDQFRIIESAKNRFANVMGYEPQGICVGYGSTNDYTCNVLYKCGFRHGMVSVPARVLPECASVHAGAPLDVHYAHRYNRVLVGDMDFVVIPLTVDSDSMMWGGKHPQDLRVELTDAKNHWYTIEKFIRRQVEQDTALKWIQIHTHNIFEFGVSGDFRRETLKGMLERIFNIAEEFELQTVAATNFETASAFREAVPLQSISQELKLDRRGYQEVAVD